MQVAILTLDFHLEGCSSLKQKRQRLKGLKDRFGRLSHIAVCESDRADCLDKAQWSFAFLSQNKAGIASAVAMVEEHAATQLDAVIYNQQLEYF
jgi:uncharacterized protein YlxP (DUF503 family)